MNRDFEPIIMECRFAGEKMAIAIQTRADLLKEEIERRLTPAALHEAIEKELSREIRNFVARQISAYLQKECEKTVNRVLLQNPEIQKAVMREVEQEIARRIGENL